MPILLTFALSGLTIIFVAAAVAYMVLKVAGRFGGPTMAWAAGIILFGAVAVLDFFISRTCAPIFTPSQCDAAGACLSVRASFGCTADAAVSVEILAYFVFPAAAAAILLLTYSIARRAGKTSMVA